MSLRRPATAASSRKLQMLPPASTSSHRPKSALSSAAIHSDDVLLQDDIPTPSSPPRSRLKKPAMPSEHESNIQVVIRCRRRSDREVQDASPVIVATNGPRGEDVTIETAAPSSILGIVTLPPTRTYPFDRVFGPEADQAMVYNDVVAPILDQVLMGYNCTLFAYGQTGTGKTYTMQGDLTPSHLGNPSAGAGMIPRVLFKLFQHLAAHVPDYSVKISFVELYNEELRDLLAHEITQPLGNAQPMGMGQQAQNQGNSGLKIFDDASKRGVFIQGLEEAGVKDAADAIALLTKGSQRRQIAATKFNEHSSRSHSVFSITVHSKETSALGEDLLKVGKLNLVDLAGSENIGRSGAENKRAREAGMINQSLLTLGRVINALVEKSSHVPYRESKLTRLLQDSLGGRTKTCIIATVSPARCNLEETLSTLEYALRARSIRNKPEVNQRLTKNALIKEYVGEIERLKADLLAAREMNGIYFSQDSWDQISADHELRQAQHDDAKRQAAIAESQLSAVREEFEQSIALLLRREEELNATKDTLKATARELHVKEGELEAVKGVLEEEVVVREAHQKTEMVLDGVAAGLKATVQKSLEDIQGLFDKLGRKSSVAGANIKAVSKYGRSLNAEFISMSSHLEEFTKTQNQFAARLQASATQFQDAENETLPAYSSMIDGQLRTLAKFVELMQATESTSNDAIEAVQVAVEDIGKAVKGSFSAWSAGLKESCEFLCGQVRASGISGAATVEEAFKAVATMLEHFVHETQEHIEEERKAAIELEALARENANSEVQRLRQQNSLLTQLLQAEKVKSERARDELIQRVSGLLGEYTEARDQSLRVAVSDLHQSISAGEIAAGKFVAAHSLRVDSGVKRRRDWEASLDKRDIERKRARKAGIEALEDVTGEFKVGLTTIQQNIVNSVASQVTEMDKQVGDSIKACSGAFDELDRVKRARIEATGSLDTEIQNDSYSLQRGLVSTSTHLNQTIDMFLNETSSLKTLVDSYHSTAATQLSNVKVTTRSLVEKSTREDVTTGTTPLKKQWEYPDQWELTKPREDVLRDWRVRRAEPRAIPDVQIEPEEVEHDTEISGLDEPRTQESVVDMDVKFEDEESVAQGTSSPLTESTSSSSTLPPTHKSTGASGFGKVSRIPGFGQANMLRERSMNLLPAKGSRRLR